MRNLAKIVLVVGSLMALASLAPNVAWAQESGATITGIVTDPSAAMIPGAAVEVANTATGVIARLPGQSSYRRLRPAKGRQSAERSCPNSRFKAARFWNCWPFLREWRSRARFALPIRRGTTG
jgi:hypothetical protein